MTQPRANATIIRVDRTIRPAYPDWMDKVVHPDLEATGPSEYTLSNIEYWLDVQQRNGRTITLHLLYTEYAADLELERCFSLHDLEAIKASGGLSAKNYAGLAWKSVVKSKTDGSFHCPYLFYDEIHWMYFGQKLGSYPALRFRK